MVQALQVVLVVQELRVSLFLEHLVSQPVQAVLGVPRHLIFKFKVDDVVLVQRRHMWHGLNQPSLQVSCSTFYPLRPC